MNALLHCKATQNRLLFRNMKGIYDLRRATHSYQIFTLKLGSVQIKSYRSMKLFIYQAFGVDLTLHHLGQNMLPSFCEIEGTIFIKELFTHNSLSETSLF